MLPFILVFVLVKESGDIPFMENLLKSFVFEEFIEVFGEHLLCECCV